MPVKKSELYNKLWEGCDTLRGGMDASQYKDYILTLLFVKYVTDKYEGNPTATVVIPQGGSFKDMAAAKGDKEIGDKINKIIAKLAEANELKGVIDVANFNDPDKLGKDKEMQDKLSKLIALFEDTFNFNKNRADGDDLLGDAYEYLMRNFATQSGKSKGQFYTPAEVSRIMAKVIGIEKATSPNQTLYDPTCGSGSLLLKAAHETEIGISIYGQENDNSTSALARMNLILHGSPTADIYQGNTLADPHFLEKDNSLKKFDWVVANPPFSYKSWRNGFHPEQDHFHRFEFGIPPQKNGDYAFLLHVISSMKSTGKGAIILPHGVLFRGNVEGEIRKNIIRKGYIKGIIALPPNLFYGTGIPACIIVLDKENAQARKGIFMIDAGKGFEKDKDKNRLRHQDIHKIVDVFNNQLEIEKYSRMVSFSEIEANDFNLNIPRYIDSSEPEDIQDIESHLLGDIPNRDIEDLQNYWDVYPSIKDELFIKGRNSIYSRLKVEKDRMRSIIHSHPEFETYLKNTEKVFQYWAGNNTPILMDLKQGVKPKKIIELISEDVLKTFSDLKLIDKYDVYQHLMDYWTSTMQDDLYMISSDGWKIELYTEGEGKKKVYKCDMVPQEIIVNAYFKIEWAEIENLEAEIESIASQIQEIKEEYAGEDGLLSTVANEKGNIVKNEAIKRIKEIAQSGEDEEELNVLQQYLTLCEKESGVKSSLKAAQEKLDNNVIAIYRELTEDKVKDLVVNEKWIPVIRETINNEMERISRNLETRIKELAERYGETLPVLEKRVQELTEKVNKHLEKMGFQWQ